MENVTETNFTVGTTTVVATKTTVIPDSEESTVSVAAFVSTILALLAVFAVVLVLVILYFRKKLKQKQVVVHEQYTHREDNPKATPPQEYISLQRDTDYSPNKPAVSPEYIEFVDSDGEYDKKFLWQRPTVGKPGPNAKTYINVNGKKQAGKASNENSSGNPSGNTDDVYYSNTAWHTGDKAAVEMSDGQEVYENT